jgi:chromosome segregation ATPase
MSDERCNADLGPLTAKLLEQQREIDRLKAERDEARAQEKKFSDDALRLLIERNRALDERDEARRMLQKPYTPCV